MKKYDITFKDGLTFKKLKKEYGWVLDATFENAVIGENNNKLVWYSGDWLDGKWK